MRLSGILVTTLATATVIGGIPAQAAGPANFQSDMGTFPSAEHLPGGREATVSGRHDFAKRVVMPGGRSMHLECRGAGSPTVVLEAGTGDLMLAALVPGADHRIAAKSDHYIQLDQPRLVTRAIRSVVRDQRAAQRQRPHDRKAL